MDSSICVAQITNLPAMLHLVMICFCARATFSEGISMPRSPRATITPSCGRRRKGTNQYLNKMLNIIIILLYFTGPPVPTTASNKFRVDEPYRVLKDLVEVLQARDVLNLGDDLDVLTPGVVVQDLADELHVLRALHEGRRHVVHLVLAAEVLQVVDVLLREHRDVHLHAGQ
eukprot:6724971-Pyramimonas_sp.AAC.1